MDYPRVKRSHVLPRGYLINFAVEGKVTMHIVGADAAYDVSVDNAAVRADFYRRTRPDGAKIDDIEWSLSQLEAAALPVARDLQNLWPLESEGKSKLAALFGYQLIRG